METVRLFVGGLHPKITPSEFAQRFLSFGEVSNVRLQCAENGDCKGFGYLNLTTSDKAQKCISTLNKTQWKGNLLRIEIAKPTYLTKLESEWAEEKRQREEEETKRQEQEEAATAPPKRISVWRRGKAGRWLPVLMVRKPNGRLGVLDPSLMKDGIRIFPDDDTGALPMDQWTWKWVEDDEPKKGTKAKTSSKGAVPAKRPAVDDEVARELRAEKKRLLAILDQVEPNAEDEKGLATEQEPGDADSDSSAEGSLEEVPPSFPAEEENGELDSEDQDQLEETQINNTEEADAVEDAEGQVSEEAEGQVSEENQEQEDERDEAASADDAGEQHANSAADEHPSEDESDNDEPPAPAAPVAASAEANAAPTTGLNVYWKSLFPEAPGGFSVLSTLGIAAPPPSEAPAAVPTPLEAATATAKPKKTAAPPVKFFSFAYDERARNPAPAASFVSPGKEEATRFWERNRSVITLDYKKKHKSATKRIQKLVKSGKSK